MRFRSFAAFLVPLSAAACVSTNATLLGPRQSLAPVPQEEVRVLLATDSVAPECRRVALIETSADADWSNSSQLVNAAKRKAGRLGANTVQILSSREPRAGTRIAAAVIGVPANRKGEMLALYCPGE